MYIVKLWDNKYTNGYFLKLYALLDPVALYQGPWPSYDGCAEFIDHDSLRQNTLVYRNSKVGYILQQ